MQTARLNLNWTQVRAPIAGRVSNAEVTDDQVEAIVTGVWGLVGVKADDALSKLPMPTIAGIQLGAPSIEAGDNAVLADVPVM